MKLEFSFNDELKTELKNLLREALHEEFTTKSLNFGSMALPMNQTVVSAALPTTQHREEDGLLSRKEAARLLGCSLTSLYNYQKKGLVPFHQLGRKILFDRTELVNHLKTNVDKY